MAGHHGTLILVFGILGFVFGIFGLVALIQGSADLVKMSRGKMDRSGELLTWIGLILGTIGFLINLLLIVMSFHALGCSGFYQDQEPGKRVARAMADQISKPRVYGGTRDAVPPSFLFHLGDLAYKDEDPANVEAKDQALIYNAQFYVQYTQYSREIFAIPGNHDGKTSKHQSKSGITHFQENFCDPNRGRSPDNTTDRRKAMCQPYPYWRLETPITTIIGLYTNDINGGQLDDPMSDDNRQYRWLVKTLAEIKQRTERKALVLALHYPPYSGGANFRERGDPNLGPTPRRGRLQPLAVLLRQAYQESNQYPDLVLSAHADRSL
jgi:hypothetical protein